MESDAFHLTVDDAGPAVIVISLAHESLSNEECLGLQSEVKTKLGQGDRRFVFDCRTTDLTSALIATLISAVQGTRPHRTVAMVGVSRQLEVLEMCRLNEMIPTFGDLGQAVSSVRGGEGPDGPGSFGAGVPAPRPPSTGSSSASARPPAPENEA